MIYNAFEFWQMGVFLYISGNVHSDRYILCYKKKKKK